MGGEGLVIVKPTPISVMDGWSQVIVKPFIYEGVFVVRGRHGGLCTKDIITGEAVYNRNVICVQNEDGTEAEYRAWNPCRSNLAAAIMLEAENIWIKPGARVLYLGAGSGKTVCHVSNIVGSNGVVYAVEISPTRYKELVNMAARRANVTSITEDARHPENYTTIIRQKVDVIYCDIAETDQVTILANNATHYLKEGGHYVMSFKVDCSDDELPNLFDQKRMELEAEEFSADEIIVLDPFMSNYGLAIGTYKVPWLRRNASKHINLLSLPLSL